MQSNLQKLQMFKILSKKTRKTYKHILYTNHQHKTCSDDYLTHNIFLCYVSDQESKIENLQISRKIIHISVKNSCYLSHLKVTKER